MLRSGGRELLHAGEDAVQAGVRLALRDAVEAADEPVVTNSFADRLSDILRAATSSPALSSRCSVA